jgi:hypothetical protein
VPKKGATKKGARFIFKKGATKKRCQIYFSVSENKSGTFFLFQSGTF